MMSEESALKDLNHGTKWFGFSRFICEIALFFSSLVLARLIAPDEWGYAAVVLGVSEVGIIVVLSLAATLVQSQKITTEEIRHAYMGALFFAAIFSVVGMIIMFGFYEISHSRLSSLCWIAVLFWPAAGIAIAPLATAQKERDFRSIALYEIVILFSGIMISLLWAIFVSSDAYALLVGSVIGYWIGTFFLLHRHPIIPLGHERFWRDHYHQAKHISLERIVYQLNRSVEFIVVFFVVGATASGILWRAKQVGYEYQNKVSDVVNRMLLPVYAFHSSLDIAQRMYLVISRGVTAVVFPFLVAGGVCMPWLIPLVFGPHWDASVEPATWFLAAGAAALLINNNHQLLVAKGHSQPAARSMLLVFVVVGISTALVAHISLTAVAVASVVWYFLVLNYQLWYLVPKYTGITVREIQQALFPILLASAIAIAASMLLSVLCSAAISVPLSILIIAGVYGWTCRVDYGNLFRALKRKPTVTEPEPVSSTS